jgi:hypothetical protein
MTCISGPTAATAHVPSRVRISWQLHLPHRYLEIAGYTVFLLWFVFLWSITFWPVLLSELLSFLRWCYFVLLIFVLLWLGLLCSVLLWSLLLYILCHTVIYPVICPQAIFSVFLSSALLWLGPCDLLTSDLSSYKYSVIPWYVLLSLLRWCYLCFYNLAFCDLFSCNLCSCTLSHLDLSCYLSSGDFICPICPVWYVLLCCDPSSWDLLFCNLSSCDPSSCILSTVIILLSSAFQCVLPFCNPFYIYLSSCDLSFCGLSSNDLFSCGCDLVILLLLLKSSFCNMSGIYDFCFVLLS